MAVTAESQRSEEAGGARSSAPALRSALVVEDSPVARRFLAQRLEGLGFCVVEAADPSAALAALAERRFDFVFLDVVLRSPDGVDGFALCRRIKRSSGSALGSPRVVMVTSLAGATDRVRGQLAGCDAYLTKPLREADFLAAVQALTARDPAGS